MFEQYIKQTGRKKVYEYPVIAFGKTHFTFNTAAIQQFNFAHNDKFLLYFDRGKKLVKFSKIPTNSYGCLTLAVASNNSSAQISSLGFIKYFQLETTKPVSVYRVESIGKNQYVINLNNRIFEKEAEQSQPQEANDERN